MKSVKIKLVFLVILLSFLKSGCSAKYQLYQMHPDFHLEQEDPKHRHGSHIKKIFDKLKTQNPTLSKESFFKWLDLNYPEIQPVKYLNSSELIRYRANLIPPRKIYDYQGIPYSEGKYIFVMDENGNFYVAKKKNSEKDAIWFQHSSFFSGGKIAAPGKFTVNKQGQIIALKNHSGHYRPKLIQMCQAFDSLNNKSMDLSKIEYISLNEQDIWIPGNLGEVYRDKCIN